MTLVLADNDDETDDELLEVGAVDGVGNPEILVDTVDEDETLKVLVADDDAVIVSKPVGLDVELILALELILSLLVELKV